MTIVNAFTVDVEDYFQVSAFEELVGRQRWEDHDCRVAANTRRILALLERHGVKATFFLLGWIAQRYPELVREIDRGGHEIGSHGYWHRLVYRQTPEEFRADLRLSRQVIEDISGRPVTAHRAASFSITRRSLWALEILVEEGFRVDSSIFPIRHDRYGIPGAEPRIHEIATAAGRLWEFPPSLCRLGGLKFPLGGGYFRLYPLPWTLFCLRRLQRRTQQPFMFYVHPWELDAQQPRIAGASRLTRFRHYVNLARTEPRLDRLLGAFAFGRVDDAVASCQGTAPRVDVARLEGTVSAGRNGAAPSAAGQRSH